MKYSLRSLMIVVTLAGIAVFAWVNHRQFCLDRAAMHQQRAIPSGGVMSFRANGAEWKRQQGISDQYSHAASMPWLRLWIDDSEPTP